MSDICNQCGQEFENVAIHWSHYQTDCEYPPISKKQLEITTGILMGDGWITRSDKNPKLHCEMISPNYLRYVDKKFEKFGNGVTLINTAEDSAQKNRKSGFSPEAEADNYSDVYRWHATSHPDFQQFADWYSSGKKVWPDDIKLTPTVLKHWYCGDGCWRKIEQTERIEIAMANEIENTEKVDAMFQRVGLPTPSNYAISENSEGGKNCAAQFGVEKSEKLWNYMGEPLPDFEYKWPDSFK